MKSFQRSLLFLLCAALFFAAERSARAQVFDCVRSVDAFVADGDAVAVGKVIEAGPQIEDSFGRLLIPVTIAVQETLRGPRAPQMHVTLLDPPLGELSDKWQAAAIVEHWKTQGTRLLVAVEHKDQKTADPGSLPLAKVIDLDAKHISEWRADYVLLTSGADVLRAARDEAKRIPAGLPRVEIVCSDKTKGFGAGTNLEDFMTIGLIVPADERLEARILGIVRGEIDGSMGSDSRYRSVEALGYFPSQENIHLLKELLVGPELRLRWGAYESLQRLGVKVTPPQS
jgi:hypothetical protein